MSREHLQDLLDRLRGELAELEDRDSRPRLEALVADLERELAADQAEGAGLTQELKRRVESFEVEHPRVTAILNDVMVTLSNLGI
ncbi:MAG: DUF4404 family protein [Gammaproteobacteria bacterium]|nr:DUF4404 family protein [Gammaproteobacteria bacterium]